MAIDQATGSLAPSSPSAIPLSKPKLPGVREVFDQAIRDLFGKDVQDTVTFSYEWLADQFGHFGLGFEITLALSWIAALLGYTGPKVGFWLGLAVVLAFVLKEADDFYREWKKAREAKSIFQFNGLEIFYNTFTAVFYIAMGAIVAAFGLLNPGYGLIALLVSAPFAAVMAYAWLRHKLTFQQSGAPYLYRLANFPNPIPKATGEFIVALSKPAPASAMPAVTNHLVIAGPLESGKSSLAIGIATEFAVRMGIGCYMTQAKLLQSVFKQKAWDQPVFDDGRVLWPWQTSDLLIVDDVDVISNHIPGTITDVETSRKVAEMRGEVLKSQIPAPLRDALKFRRTVWVVGDIGDGELIRWRDIIADIIGVDGPQVQTLQLAQNLSDLDPNRPRPTAADQVKQ
jgi:hypothetical protein